MASTLLHKAGDKNAIEELQRFLLTYGFTTEEPDGAYGPKTRKAVKAFQKKLEITADGLVGPATVKAMLDFGSTTPIPKTKDSGKPNTTSNIVASPPPAFDDNRGVGGGTQAKPKAKPIKYNPLSSVQPREIKPVQPVPKVPPVPPPERPKPLPTANQKQYNPLSSVVPRKVEPAQSKEISPQPDQVSTDPATNTIVPKEEPPARTVPKEQPPAPQQQPALDGPTIAKKLLVVINQLKIAKNTKGKIPVQTMTGMINQMKDLHINGYETVIKKDPKLLKHYTAVRKSLLNFVKSKVKLQDSTELAATIVLLENYKLNEAVEKPEDVPELADGKYTDWIEIDPSVLGTSITVKFYASAAKNHYWIVPQEDIDIDAKTYRKNAKITLEELRRDKDKDAWGWRVKSALYVCFKVLQDAEQNGGKLQTERIRQQQEQERQTRAQETVDEYYNMFKSVLDELGWTPDEMPSNEYMKEQYIAIGNKIKEINSKLDAVKEQGTEILGQITDTADDLIQDMSALTDLTVNYAKNINGPQVGGTGPDYEQEQPGVEAPVQRNVAEPTATNSSQR